MTTYLTIITTVLVITQIIRVTQNAIQLSRTEKKINKHNQLIERVYGKLDYVLDLYVDEKTNIDNVGYDNYLEDEENETL